MPSSLCTSRSWRQQIILAKADSSVSLPRHESGVCLLAHVALFEFVNHLKNAEVFGFLCCQAVDRKSNPSVFLVKECGPSPSFDCSAKIIEIVLHKIVLTDTGWRDLRSVKEGRGNLVVEQSAYIAVSQGIEKRPRFRTMTLDWKA